MIFGRFHFLGALAAWIMVASAAGQELRPKLERELVAKLIAVANQVRANEVTVGPMQAVDEKIGPTSVATGGLCVTFIAPVIEEGRRVRQVQKRFFYYDDDWGWYLFAIETLRGGEGVDVVSEREGRMILR